MSCRNRSTTRIPGRAIAMVAGIVCLALTAACGQAGGESPSEAGESYPDGPVTLLVGFSAGSATDLFARVAAKVLKQQQGWTVTVQNVEGASGALAIQRLLSQPSDGQTILVDSATVPFVVVAESLRDGVDELQGVATLAARPAVLAVSSTGPHKDIAAFVENAKNAPGQVSIGVPGTVSVNTYAMYQFTKEAGIDLKWIPYDGGSELAPALLGNEVDSATAAATNFLSNVESGDLKLLATTASDDYTGVEGVPTLTESGYGPELMAPYSFTARKGVDDGVLDKLADAFREVSESSEWKKYADSEALQTEYRGPEETQDAMEDLYADVKETLPEVQALFN